MDDSRKTKDQLIKEMSKLRKRVVRLEKVEAKWKEAGKKLHNSEEIHEQTDVILNTSMDGFWIVDTQGNILTVNEAYCRMIGYTREELLSMNISDVEARESFEDIDKHIQHIRKRGYHRFETRHRRKTGTIIDIEISTNYLEDDGGGIFAFFRDITRRKKTEEELKKYQKQLKELVRERTKELEDTNNQLLIEIAERKRAEKALQEREESLAMAQEIANIGSWDWNIEKDMLTWSDKTYRQFGFEPNEITPTYKIFESLIHPDDLDFFNQRIKKALSDKKAYSIETRIKNKDGREWIMYAQATVYRDENGKPVRLVGIQQDITERKHMDEEKSRVLRDLGERVKEIKCLYSISKLEHQEKVSLDYVYQKTCNLISESWLYPDITCARISIDDNVYKTDNYRKTKWKQSTDIKVYENKKGKVEVCYLKEMPELDEGPFLKEERELIDTIAERLGRITERKKAEEELRKSAALIDILGDAVMRITLDKNLAKVNKAFSDLWGYSSEEVIGKSVFNMFPEREKPKHEKEMKEAIKTGKSRTFETVGLTKNGKEFNASIIGTVVLDEKGKPINLLASFRDITERKRTETIREESEEKFSKAFRTSLDSIAITSIDEGRFVDVNETFLDVFGYQREEVIGKTSNELNIWDSYEQRNWIVQELKEKGTCKDVDVKFRKRSGDSILGLFSATVMNLSDGPVMLSMMKDITGRKRAEDLLRIQRDLSIAFGVSRDLKQVLEQLLNVAFRMENVDAGGVYLRNIETGELDLIAHRGLPEQFIKVASHYTADAPQTQLVGKGEPIHAHYNKLGIPLDEDHKKEALKAISVIPIKHENIVIGALNLASHIHSEFSTTTRDTIEAIAGMIGGALVRVRAETALRESEEKYRMLIANIPYVTWISDSKGHTTFISSNVKRVYGYKAEEIYNEEERLWFGRIHPDDKEKVTDAWEKFFKEKQIYDIEYRIQRKDDKWIWLHDRAVDTYEEDGKLYGYGIFSDITARKLMQNALQESEEKYRTLFESSPDPITVTDLEGNIIACNEPTLKVLGFSSKEEVLGKSTFKWIAPKDRQKAQIYMKKTIEQGSMKNMEYAVVRKNGQKFPAEVSASLIADNKGNPMSFVSIIKDITVRKQAEEKEKLQQEQLIQADKMASLGVLVSGVGHEINNPNNYILPNSRIISRAWKDIKPALNYYYNQSGDFTLAGLPYTEAYEEIGKMIDGISKGAERIRAIVQGLRNYARPTIGGMKEKVDINQVAQAAISLTENLIKKSTVSFTKKYRKNIPLITGNAQHLEQVIVNLITNACHALQNDTKNITLSTDYDADLNRVVVKVADEGSGISKGNLKKIMDPFFTTKRDRGGTGLGLPISYNIIQSHGGDLLFESKRGKGTTATVVLPEIMWGN